ncbi:hypothetical protein QTO34_004421 [Cnephaeus nilssonii]|uniref:Uncharacterized protein n=1 Tax=Cnephaeus nilssonii TaxID=3371016 RepID=A0AA40HQ05_CNENI|nr:hypothetical protein QTO34_004421 [Eptesicus nilssonii]
MCNPETQQRSPLENEDQLETRAVASACPSCPTSASCSLWSLGSAIGWHGRSPDGGSQSHKLAAPSHLSPARVAGVWHGRARPGPPPGGSGRSACLLPESPSPFSPPAAQGQPEAQASLGWWLPSHPGLPEAQIALTTISKKASKVRALNKLNSNPNSKRLFTTPSLITPANRGLKSAKTSTLAMTLCYWDTRGWLTPSCLLLEYTDSNCEKKYTMGDTPDYDRSQWLSEKFKLGLDFPICPS